MTRLSEIEFMGVTGQHQDGKNHIQIVRRLLQEAQKFSAECYRYTTIRIFGM